ncbi:MAG: ABC transporter ATP-binding protein [Proteobacteria bacterium]|nr:ABC transporter ATP-binding protein [Pseudomonadota bacterium]
MDATSSNLIEARGVSVRYGQKLAVDDVGFTVAPGRVIGLLGHNGAGKTSLMKAMVGLLPFSGSLAILGLDPRKDRVKLLESVCYIPDVAILPRWARVDELITLMQGLHPRFSADRARTLLRRTSIQRRAKVKSLSKGMVVQLHLALIAAIDARVMILDEPTLGLDILSRKAFYEMLIDEWCDGERSVVISTHQVEEIQPLLSDVMMLNEGRVVLSTSLVDIDRRFVGLSHDPEAAESIAAAHPLLRFRQQGQAAALFDGAPPAEVAALGRRFQPSLADLFVALTRAPEMNRTQA